MSNVVQDLPQKDIIKYGLIAVPLAFAGLPLYIHVPDYYVTNFGASLTSIGIVLLLLRFIDALQDPLIGAVSDWFSGQRISIMFWFSLVLLIGFVALFNPLADINILVWLGASLFLATSAYSVLVINLTAIGGLWSPKKHEMTRISATREAFGVLGLLLAVLLPSVLTYLAPEIAVFNWIGFILGCLLLIGFVVFVSWYRNYKEALDFGTQLEPPSSFKYYLQLQMFSALPSQTKMFLLIYSVSMLASSIPAILVIFFIRDLLNAESLTGLFLLIYFLSGAIGMPFWYKFSQAFKSKEKAWFAAMLLAVVSFIWAAFLSAGDVASFAIICAVSGFAFGADLALPPSILSGHIHKYKKQADASFLFAQLSLLAKIALAASTALVFPMLDLFEFNPGGANDPEALAALTLTYAALPCLIKMVAIVLIWQSIKTLKPERDMKL